MPAYKNYHGWITLDYDISVKSAKRQSDHIDNYQSKELNDALAYCTQFRTAIDIGAHIGIISFQLSKKFKSVHSLSLIHI